MCYFWWGVRELGLDISDLALNGTVLISIGKYFRVVMRKGDFLGVGLLVWESVQRIN